MIHDYLQGLRANGPARAQNTRAWEAISVDRAPAPPSCSSTATRDQTAGARTIGFIVVLQVEHRRGGSAFNFLPAGWRQLAKGPMKQRIVYHSCCVFAMNGKKCPSFFPSCFYASEHFCKTLVTCFCIHAGCWRQSCQRPRDRRCPWLHLVKTTVISIISIQPGRYMP
jgi:hypothetical protein